MRPRHLAPLLLLALAVLTGCAGAGTDGGFAPGAPAGMPAATEVAADTKAAMPGFDAAGSDRSIVRTAWLTLRVDDLGSTAREIAGLARDAGGEVTAEDSGTAGTDPYASLTVKVPADGLDGFLEAVRALGTQVSSSVSAVDVTMQAQDLDARIATLRASTERMRELMDDATQVADIVAIEAELGARQAELDGLLAQQRLLDDQVAMSSVTVTLVPEVTGAEASAPGFLPGLRSGWNALRSAAAWLTTSLGFLVPFALLAAIAVAVVAVPVRAVVRRRRRVGADRAGG